MGGGGEAVVVGHVRDVVVLVGKRRDDVLKARGGASPSLMRPGCFVAREGDLGARATEGDALPVVGVVKGTVVAAPPAWVRAMNHGGAGGEMGCGD